MNSVYNILLEDTFYIDYLIGGPDNTIPNKN